MEQPYAPLLNRPVSVIGPQFCAPYFIELGMEKKLITITDGVSFVVTDGNGSILFKVRAKPLAFLHRRRVLIDAAGNPIVTLQPKGIITHQRWQAFRGKSTDPKDMIFSAKKSSMLQLKTKVHVFMANNTREDVCDFRVEGSWFGRSFAIYLGQSSGIIAQIHKKLTMQSVLIGKDNFMVTVQPNVDFAFIVALIVIFNEINHDTSDGGGGGD